MNVRAFFASLVLCGAVSLGAGRAEAQIIFGYAGGATFKGEVAGYGYGYGAGGGCGGYGCGDWGCGGHGCGAGVRGAWIHGGKFGAGGCWACKTRRFGHRNGCDGGCNFGCDNCTPVEGDHDLAPPKDVPTPAPSKEDESTANGPSLFRSVSHEQGAGPTFAQGWLAYRSGNHSLAVETLSAVVANEPRNAAAQYALALAQHELGDAALADATLAQAVAFEAEHPVAGFGKLMERVQGQRRVWLESARREVGR